MIKPRVVRRAIFETLGYDRGIPRVKHKFGWAVLFEKKEDVVFEHWTPAIVFATYLFRNPHILPNKEEARDEMVGNV